ncbi:MAG TPA: hypothetical protein PKB10_04505, partial [Tepidisphaeraceae bacterium]|nr:hypothetical protein [Tepidisphaeraceae bacterium]
VEIVDAVLGVEPRAVLTWTMITDAEIEAASPQTLTLRKSGKTATLTVLSPADARFVHALIDEKRRPFESENPGASAIRLELTGRRDHDIVVRLTTAEAADPKRLDAARPSAWRD